MKRFKFGIIALIACCAVSFTSCFNLEEEVFSEITEASFVPTEQDVAALLASAYTSFAMVMEWQGYFDTQEEPGDVIITPTRPNGWDDAGTYRRMHQHAWDNQQWQPYNVYQFCYTGINNANRVKDQVEAGELPIEGALGEALISELRAVRAFWYSILLDTHGNVPFVTAFTDEIPKQIQRKDLYDFVISELTEVLPSLSEEKSMATYGRVNKWTALMVLARTYLNAEVYTGTPQWEKALDCAQQIIDSGLYQLAPDFSDNFKKTNDWNNVEVIFAVPYDPIYTTAPSFCQHAKWYPPTEGKAHFGWSYQTWGGSCANPQFINSYQPGDKRKEKTWLIGPQYVLGSTTEVAWTAYNYLPSLTCKKGSEDKTNIEWGARVFKYEVDTETDWLWGNDFPWFRYAETLLIKAECLLRLGKDKQTAADLVSQIRARAFDNAEDALITVAELEGDTKIQYGLVDWGDLEKRENKFTTSGDQSPVYLGGLYDEYGWEFACEAQRRTQMIRFGTFSTKDWFNHNAAENGVNDGHTAIFPIPLDELTANQNLVQNPGY